MSKVPNGKYSVKLITNTWADGVLDTTADPPTYTLDSGNNSLHVSNWHPSTDKVGWEVPLTPPGGSGSFSITFYNGHFSAKQKPVIQRGKAKGFPPGTGDDPQDTWSASELPVGAEGQAPTGV
jgi:hypothetical protein